MLQIPTQFQLASKVHQYKRSVENRPIPSKPISLEDFPWLAKETIEAAKISNQVGM